MSIDFKSTKGIFQQIADNFLGEPVAPGSLAERTASDVEYFDHLPISLFISML